MIRTFLSNSRAHCARFHADEAGNGTIEFMLFIPFIFAFFLSSFELGMLMIRQTMLDRGVDLTVRLIRLNQVVDANGDDAITRENLRRSICFFSGGLVPSCDERLRVEMQRADPHNWQPLGPPDCVNVEQPAAPSGVFDPTQENELMVLRVCALIQPFSFTSGLGAGLQRQSGELYALFSSTAFVVEPIQ